VFFFSCTVLFHAPPSLHIFYEMMQSLTPPKMHDAGGGFGSGFLSGVWALMNMEKSDRGCSYRIEWFQSRLASAAATRPRCADAETGEREPAYRHDWGLGTGGKGGRDWTGPGNIDEPDLNCTCEARLDKMEESGWDS